MNLKAVLAAFAVALLLHVSTAPGLAQGATDKPAAQKIIIDTDIGDDIDDAYAVALALSSPEVKIVGITSAWGDTALRSRLLDRLLCETGRSDIPVYTGVATKTTTKFTQRPWAEAGRAHTHTDAVTFLLNEIRQNPDEITLVAIGPLTNIGTAITRDPATFSKLKRVVMMGGSINRGYGAVSDDPSRPRDAEYNIARDPTAAQKLFDAGVPIYMMPLDSTQLKFEDANRSQLASISTPLTDSLQVLTAEWQRGTGQKDPTLYDPVAMAYAIDPETCPTRSFHIDVDDKGFTSIGPGQANANICLEPHPDAFFRFFMPRLLNQKMTGTQACVAPDKP